MRKKLQELLTQYGPIAAVTWFAIFFLVLGGFALALQFGFNTGAVTGWMAKLGFNPDGIAAQAGVWTAAYGLTKIVQPLRIALWLLVTPLLSRVWQKVRGPARTGEGMPPPPAAP